MIIKINTELLKKQLDLVEKCLPKTTNMPVLKNIYFENYDGKLTFMSNDLETGIRCSTQIEKPEQESLSIRILEDDSREKSSDEAEGGLFESNDSPDPEDGVMEIPWNGKVLLAPRITDIVRHMRSNEMEIVIMPDSYKVKVTGGQSKFDLTGAPVDDYPLLPEHQPEKKPLVIKSGELKEIIRQTVFAISTDATRPAFSGVLFDFMDNKLKVVASDTYRLTMKNKQIENWEYDDNKVLVPGKSLKELLRILDDDEMPVEIYPASKQLIFKFAETYFYTRLLEDKFPDFTRVIPTDFVANIIVNRKEFSYLIERAMLLSNDGNQTAIISVKELEMNIRAVSDIGRMEESISLIEKEGQDIEILLNVRFIMDVLKVLDNERICFYFGGSEAPCIIRPENDDNFLYLVLPIKMDK